MGKLLGRLTGRYVWLLLVCLIALPAATNAAPSQRIDVFLVGDENDGSYSWDGMKDPWEKDADALFVDSGTTRIFFVWPPNNGSHDVQLRKSQSTPGVSFPAGSVLHQNYGSENEYWPAAGWVPIRAGTYQLYCSKHTAMKMRVIVRAQLARIGAKTNRGRIPRGTRSLTGIFVANAAIQTRVKVVLCTNNECSRSREVYSRVHNIAKGRRELKIAFRSGFGTGSYQLQAITPAITLRSSFSVR